MLDDHAVIVGIDTYPGLSQLGGPCEDARLVRDWLLDPACGDVPAGNIKVLLTSDYHPPGPTNVNDVHPVEDEVNDLFRPLVTQGLMNGRIGRRLFIYLAGHGFSDPSDMASAALFAANAEMVFAPHIAGTGYANWFRRNGIFDEIVLIMDCCRTVNPMQTIRPPPLPNTNQPSQAAKVRTFYAFGTSWGAVARERPMNGSVRGIFTTALLESLSSARPNRNGRVTGQIVKNYVHNIIDRVADGTDISPPDIQVDSSRDIAFVERQQAPKLTARFTLAPHSGEEILLVSDGSGTVQDLSFDEAQKTLPLSPGLYKALVQGTDRSKLFEMVNEDVDITL